MDEAGSKEHALGLLLEVVLGMLGQPQPSTEVRPYPKK
jgi:hypothetical protein